MYITNKQLLVLPIPSLVVGVIFFGLGIQEWNTWSDLADLLFRLAFVLCLVYQLLLWVAGIEGGNARKARSLHLVGMLYPLFCTVDTVRMGTPLSDALILEGFVLFSNALLFVFIFGISFKKASP